MSKYRIKGTDILHNGKVYPDGSEIELNDKDFKRLEDYLELLQESKKQHTKPAKATQNKSEPEKEPEKQVTEEKTTQENKAEDSQKTEALKPENSVPKNMRRE
jgi:hypothetical protein